MSLRFGEIQTFVSNLAQSIRFYGDVLGLRLKETRSDWAVFDVSGVELLLMAAAYPRLPGPYGKDCGTVLCLRATDLDAEVTRLKQAGAGFLVEIREMELGRYAVLADPDGTPVELLQPRAASSPA